MCLCMKEDLKEERVIERDSEVFSGSMGIWGLQGYSIGTQRCAGFQMVPAPLLGMGSPVSCTSFVLDPVACKAPLAPHWWILNQDSDAAESCSTPPSCQVTFPAPHGHIIAVCFTLSYIFSLFFLFLQRQGLFTKLPRLAFNAFCSPGGP